MKRGAALLTPKMFSIAWLVSAAAVQAQPALTVEQKAQIDEYCLGCHNFDDFAGSLDLSLVLDDEMSAHSETWEKVIRKLRAGMMPPPGQPRPAWDEYTALTEQLEENIDSTAPQNPGPRRRTASAPGAPPSRPSSAG